MPVISPQLQANRRHSRHRAGMKSRIHETVPLNLHIAPKPPLPPCEQKYLSITAKSVKAHFAKFAHGPRILSPLRCGSQTFRWGRRPTIGYRVPCHGTQPGVSSSCQRSMPRRAWNGPPTRFPLSAGGHMSPHIQSAKRGVRPAKSRLTAPHEVDLSLVFQGRENTEIGSKAIIYTHV